MIEKVVEIGILYDFYGKLLSSRQISIIELFYLHDLSLAEIGEELDITRQAVYDTLKRAEKKLYDYEESLGLVEEFKKNNIAIKSILSISKAIIRNIEEKNKNKSENILAKIKEIEDIGQEILKNSREVGN